MNIRSKRAFITGAYGQDGSYLAEYLLQNGYEVLGLVHDADGENAQARTLESQEGFSVCVGDLAIPTSYQDVLNMFHPDEIYNLAAVSDLKTARDNPELTIRLNYTAVQDLASFAISMNPQVRIFQALSSRILAPDTDGVIRETSSLGEPKNAYDEAKRKSLEDVVLPLRREGYFIASGFLCNHESPRRGARFVTGKIAQHVANVRGGDTTVLMVGNMNARRDWSFAGDFARAMHAVLQTEHSDDYVFGSGTLHTVREFIEVAFSVIGISLRWEGEGKAEKGYDAEGVLRVAVEEAFYEPDDNPVVSDIRYIQEKTGWQPEVSFTALVTMMVEAELRSAAKN